MRRELVLISGLLLALASAAAFAWLAYHVAGGATLDFDQRVRAAVHSAASPAFTSVMRALSFIGEPYVLWPIAAILFFLLRRAGLNASLLAIAMFGEVALEQTMKFTFRRQRPSAYFGYPQPHSYSFPSGHALASLVFFITLATLVSPLIRSQAAKALLWCAAVLMVAGIGYSRIYLGVHYPTDVIGGYMAAIVWVLAIAVGNHTRRRGINKDRNVA